MRAIIIICFSLGITNLAISKSRFNTQNSPITIEKLDTIKVIFPDSIKIPQNYNIKTPDKSNWSDIMPWVVALFIGLLTVITGRLQIISSEKIIFKQIESAKEIAQQDFNKTVISGNRQEWINKLRDNLSEYLARVESYSIETKNTNIDTRLLSEELIKILTLEIKIVLLLNSKEENSQNLIKYLGLFSSCLTGKSITETPEVLKTMITNVTKKILKTEWERVKKGE